MRMPKLQQVALYLSPLAGRGRIALAIRVRGSLRERDRNGFKYARHIPTYPLPARGERLAFQAAE
jgi:hypothetical protein